MLLEIIVFPLKFSELFLKLFQNITKILNLLLLLQKFRRELQNSFLSGLVLFLCIMDILLITRCAIQINGLTVDNLSVFSLQILVLQLYINFASSCFFQNSLKLINPSVEGCLKLTVLFKKSLIFLGVEVDIILEVGFREWVILFFAGMVSIFNARGSFFLPISFYMGIWPNRSLIASIHSLLDLVFSDDLHLFLEPLALLSDNQLLFS